MTALTGEELLTWVEQTTAGWRGLAAQHPEMLSLPCDVRESHTVAELLQHIAAVELRCAQRLHGMPESTYDQISSHSAEQIFQRHDQAMALVQTLLQQENTPWEESIEFETRSVGRLRATRRTILAHLFLHSIRHYAQLATLVRQNGIQPGWPMDYLFLAAQPPKP